MERMAMHAAPRTLGIAIATVAAAVALFGCGSGAVPAQTPPASGDPAGISIRISATQIAFDQAELAVPSNQPFTIVFENRDAVPHNVSVFAGATGGERRFEGAVFSGPVTRWYLVPALAPGTYRFVCDVHPSMTGRLVAS
jgi:plastocyanin